MSEIEDGMSSALESAGQSVTLAIARLEAMGRLMKTIETPNKPQMIEVIDGLKEISRSIRGFADVIDQAVAYGEAEVLKEL